MRPHLLQKFQPYLAALALSFCGGAIFQFINIPLPWMLGPLFFVGLSGIRGVRVKEIKGSRQTGQLIIGCNLGLYFTAEVGREILNYGFYIVGVSFCALFLGMLGGFVLQRIAKTSPTTSFFASLPGGATEMAVLAERAGARPDQVALCHSIRILIIVTIIPFAVTMSGAGGMDIYIPSTLAVNPEGLAITALLGILSGFIFMKAKISNAWFLGPLALIAALTLNDVSLSAIPSFLLILAQVLLSCALGTQLKPSLAHESKGLLLGVLCSGLTALCLFSLMGATVAVLMDESIPTLILATSPGGLPEMCITAKILKLGVPLVTSFQVMRLAVVVSCALPAWKLLQAIQAKR